MHLEKMVRLLLELLKTLQAQKVDKFIQLTIFFMEFRTRWASVALAIDSKREI